MPMWMSLSFQDSNSPLMENMSFFHDHMMIIILTITVMTAYLLLSSVLSKFFNLKNTEDQHLEVFWTTLPMLILIFISMPSLKILYMADEMNHPVLTIKTMGHQWFWSYEYSEVEKIQFDSFMNQELTPRLLQTNNHMVCPTKMPIRIITSSSDVIHSWTIPSLGVKVDAIPGRLNQLFINIKRTGIMAGQCSEICGTNHSFMPITISAIPPTEFYKSIKMI
uniref:Cytochrome c oxidase subunit 2 n=1 Tax=Unionicola parkeri TaxID=350891 RepID=E3W3L5_9ACAR|nr:cytochrome c oxidase subunit II [Unionicola parkeri]ADP01825.1 cytochrome oxidase subunit 2 [Unionicola parkeri]